MLYFYPCLELWLFQLWDDIIMYYFNFTNVMVLAKSSVLKAVHVIQYIQPSMHGKLEAAFLSTMYSHEFA